MLMSALGPYCDDMENALDNTGESGEKNLPYKCDFCDKTFDFYCRLSAHHRRHTGEKPFSCEICQKRYASISTLNIHRKLHLGVEDLEKSLQFQCDFCYKRFDFQCRLDVHRRIHTGEKPFPCEICERKFTDKRALNVHKKLKHGLIFNSVLMKGFVYECKECYKTFTYKRQLIIHQQSHSTDKPFSCKFCLQPFARVESLKIHVQIHKSEKPYQCEVCYERFAIEEELDVHGRRHEAKHQTVALRYSPSKNYRCEFCDKWFVYESRLKLHRTVHTRPYVCKICDRRFARKYVIRRHMKIHGIEWQEPLPESKNNSHKCRLCKVTFPSVEELSVHQEMHLGESSLSDSSFSESMNLEFTDKSKSNESVDKTQLMKLKPSVLIERLTVAHNCEKCGQSFPSQCQLERHKELQVCAKPVCNDVSLSRNDFNHCDFEEQALKPNHMLKTEIITCTYKCDMCDLTFVSHVELMSHQESHERLFLNGEYFLNKNLVKEETRKRCLKLDNGIENMILTCTPEICTQPFVLDEKMDSNHKLLSNETTPPSKFFNGLSSTAEKEPLESVGSVVSGSTLPAFKCQVCLVTLTSQAEMNEHKETQHDAKLSDDLFEQEMELDFIKPKKSLMIEKLSPLYKCRLCQRTFSTSSRLSSHEALHSNSCRTSDGSTFSETKESRLDIQNTSHPDRSVIIEQITLPHRCKMCEEAFSSKKNMEDHQLTHADEEFPKCNALSPETCKLNCKVDELLQESNKNDFNLAEPEIELFIENSSYEATCQARQKVNAGKKTSFSCELCESKFGDKQDYNLHKKTHRDKKPFSCDMCPKKYWKRWNLKLHKAKHTHTCFHRNSNMSRFHRNSNVSRFYQCEFCRKTFSWQSELNTHRRIHTGEKTFSCQMCHKRFPKKDQLNIHRKLHLGLKPFSCPTCHKQFSQKERLILHRKFLHPNEESFNSTTRTPCKYECEYCAKVFYVQYQFRTHLRVHTGEKPYSCEVCDKRFTRKWSLALHRTLHTQTTKFTDIKSNKRPVAIHEFSTRKSIQMKKIFKCDSCNADFISNYLLQNHLQIHKHNSWSFSCFVCLKPYSTRNLLLNHSKLHIKNPYFCVQCGRVYNTLSKLTTHVRIRHTEKPFACCLCNRSFDKKKYLNTHSKIHLLNRTFSCQYCDKVFPYESLVNSHKKVHFHRNHFKCNTCFKKFPSISTLSRHKKTHMNSKTYACKICQKIFITKTTFELHVRSHRGRKPYSCNMCGKEYFYLSRLNYHISSHTDHKPFHCPLCPMRFPERAGLNRHVKTHTGEKPFACNKCHTYFSRKTTLQCHEKNMKCSKS